MTTATEYNGWSNYSTWKTNLELVNTDYYYSMITDDDTLLDPSNLADLIQQDCESRFDQCQDELVRNWALSLLSWCNFYEIAQSILNDFKNN